MSIAILLVFCLPDFGEHMPGNQLPAAENKSHASRRTLTKLEFRMIAFITTLLLAGIVIVIGNKEPVVWGFLGTAIGVSVGQSLK
jgi:hypothetical protein